MTFPDAEAKEMEGLLKAEQDALHALKNDSAHKHLEAWIAAAGKLSKAARTALPRLLRMREGVHWAQGLIEQLPATHVGRNSWLLNHGVGDEADAKRAAWKRAAISDGRSTAPIDRVEAALAPAGEGT
jgi:hypothetical protein